MDTKRILSELHAERERIDRAISAIEGINGSGTRRRRSTSTATPKRRRHISAAGRKRLSELMKKRWAQGKMRGRAKAA